MMRAAPRVCAMHVLALENIFHPQRCINAVGGVIFSDESFFNSSWHGNECTSAVPLVPAASAFRR